MAFPIFKKKVVNEICSGAWGHLVSHHKVDVDTLSREFRCVERQGDLNGSAVTFLRVFKPSEAQQKGAVVTGWETFDQYPELVWFEGYLTSLNKASLERKRE